MTDLPTPRYRIGDVVYRATTEAITERMPCPDCLGERKWRATAPNGIEHTVACPRCSMSYGGLADNLPSLDVRRYKPKVVRLTIGSITVKSEGSQYHGDSTVQYMCNEIGIGSGSIYNERDLFSSDVDALLAARYDADTRNEESAATPKSIAARHFSNLTIDEALQTHVRDQVFTAWAAFRNLRYAIDDAIEDNTSRVADEIREAIDRCERYVAQGIYEDNPVQHLIDVARHRLPAPHADPGGVFADLRRAVEALEGMLNSKGDKS
jgi:hypothetical protein